MKKITILLVFILFAFESCIKSDDQCNFGGSYEFILPFNLKPVQEVFHLGDTITISSNFNNPIYDRTTNDSYNLNNFKFYMSSSIFYMDTSIIDYKNMDYFDLIIDSNYWHTVFKYNDGTSDLGFQYNFNNNSYDFKIKLIPRKTGNFFIFFSSSIWLQGPKQDFQKKCPNKTSRAVVYTNGRQDNNAHLLLESLNDYYQIFYSKKETQYLDLGGYCFKVIE